MKIDYTTKEIDATVKYNCWYKKNRNKLKLNSDQILQIANDLCLTSETKVKKIITKHKYSGNKIDISDIGNGKYDFIYLKTIFLNKIC